MLSVWLPLNGDLRNQGLANITATNNGATVDNNGKIGKCYSFDGNNLYGDWSEINTLTQISGCCWVYLNNLSSAQYFFHLGGQSSYPCKFSLDYEGSIRFQINGTEYISGITLTTGIWYHLAITWNGTMAKLYVNGIESYSKSASGSFSASNHFAIGARTNGTAGNTFAYAIKNGGKLSDIRFYDHALSPREVKQVSTALVLHYPLSMPGQENLLVTQISDNKWVNWRANATWDSTNTREKILGDDGKTWAHIIQNTTDGYGGYACDPSYNQIVIDSSKKYTWSCIAKAGAKENAEIVLWYHWRSTEGGANLSQSAKKFQLTSNPQRISWTLPQYTNDTYTVNRINLMMGTSGTGNNEIYFTDVKFEEGSRPTPWLPNPADTKYAALGFNDGIEYDVSGYNHNGTKHSITYDSDTPRYQVCSVLDGTSYIKIDTNEWMVQGAQALTWSIWAYSDDWSTETDGGRLVSCTESGGFNIEGGASGYLRVPFYVFKDSEGSSKGYVYYNSSIQLASLTPGWHLFTTTYSTEAIKTYVDGALTYSYSYTSYGIGFNKNARLFLGCEAATANSGGAYFNGKLSDFRLYYTTLSAEDVYNLYAVGASLSDTGVLFSNEVSEV